MRSRALVGIAIATALAGALWISQSPASAQGWGMMGGYGPGNHMGWGVGPGWNCPAFAQGSGSGPAGGYGPGYHMRGGGGGYGPGMMQGYGYDRSDDAQANQNLNLTTDDVKSRMERWLVLRDNPRLKLGEVKEKDADAITVDVVTKDNSLVDRFIVDRHTGFTRRDNS
jgi:hypothetical protein